MEKRIRGNIENALEAVGKNIGIKDYKVPLKGKLGIAFLVPYVRPSLAEEKDALVRDFFNTAKKIETDLTVFFTNPKPIEEQIHLYPGIAIMGKLIK